MHDVHTFMRFGVPGPTLARTVWMFGFQRRRVRRCECEMLLPKPGPLPHTSQTEATGHSKVEDWRIRIMGAARASHARQGQPSENTQRNAGTRTERAGKQPERPGGPFLSVADSILPL